MLNLYTILSNSHNVSILLKLLLLESGRRIIFSSHLTERSFLRVVTPCRLSRFINYGLRRLGGLDSSSIRPLRILHFLFESRQVLVMRSMWFYLVITNYCMAGWSSSSSSLLLESPSLPFFCFTVPIYLCNTRLFLCWILYLEEILKLCWFTWLDATCSLLS